MTHQPHFRRPSLLLFVIATLLVVGCSTRPDYHPDNFTLGMADQFSMTPETGRVNVPIYFATDRQYVDTDTPTDRFNDERGELAYGRMDVSISKLFKVGQQGKLSSQQRKDLYQIESVDVMEQQGFIDAVNDQLDRVGKREITVIVHGYNETFDGFMRWVGQFVYQIGYEGVMVVYSWPSWGRLSAYTVDENTVEWAIPGMLAAVKTLKNETQAENVNLVSHSMGVRVLSGTLLRLAYERKGDTRPLFGEVIFAAPDIDVEVLAQRMPYIMPLAQRYTVYRSSTDLALRASETVHGLYPRAGQGGEGVKIIDGVDTIDVSFVDDSSLGHVYLAQTRAVVSDAFMLLNHRLPPEQRNLLKMNEDGKTYWLIRP